MHSEGGPPREVIIRISEDKKSDRMIDLLLDGDNSNVDDDYYGHQSDSQSSVSSLGIGEPRVVSPSVAAANAAVTATKHELDRALGETEEDEEGDAVNRKKHSSSAKVASHKQSESPGLVAARERYRSQSSSSPHHMTEKNAQTSSSNNKNNNTKNTSSNNARTHHSEKTPLIRLPDPASDEDEDFYNRGTNMEVISLGEEHIGGGGDHNENTEVIDIEVIRKERRSLSNNNHKKLTPSDDTSKTASGTDDSPDGKHRHHSHHKKAKRQQQQQRRLQKKVEREGAYDGAEEADVDDDYDDDDEDNESSSGGNSAQKLLHRAQERLVVQKLHEELDDMKQVVAKKNDEINILAGQLRRAVETKCDLVLAHTEMEQYHEFTLQAKDQVAHELLKTNFGLMEGSADIEKQLLNEIVKLRVESQELEKRHIQELQDWERLHKNEMLERDCEIARLKDEVHKLVVRGKSGGTSSSIGRLPQHPIRTELIDC